MNTAENDVQMQIADIAVKSILSALPRKRNFTDRLLLEVVKRSITIGARKYLETLSTARSQPKNQPTRSFTLDLVPQVSVFATQTEKGKFTVYERLPSLIAPHLEGAHDLKLALCYAMASTPEYPLHILLIGEPATVKTELLEEAGRTIATSVLAGPRSTQAGLTMNLSSGSLGFLAKANGSVALIDELDKLPAQAIKSLYEAMESGRITVNSGTLSREIEAKFTCIATANPKGDLLTKGKDTIRKQLLSSIPAALLSRFHLAFILDHPAGPQLEKTVTKILSRSSRDNPNLEFLRAYFETIKHVCPVIRCELDSEASSVRKAQKFLSKKITESNSGKLCVPLSVRSAEALKRLCISSARMRLSPRVEDVDVGNAISIMKSSLVTWE